MLEKYELLFEKEVLRRLNKLHSKKDMTTILNKMFDKIELQGPLAGKLLSNRLKLYEMKMKSPPLRLYYQVQEEKKEIHIIEFEMKSSEKQQKKTIGRIRRKLKF